MRPSEMGPRPWSSSLALKRKRQEERAKKLSIEARKGVKVWSCGICGRPCSGGKRWVMTMWKRPRRRALCYTCHTGIVLYLERLEADSDLSHLPVLDQSEQ